MSNFITGVKSVTSKFYKDSCFVRASGLAYSSLLAIVPFTTVIYAFGGFDNIGHTITKLLLDSLIPEQQSVILSAINDFTKNSLATGAFGMIFFLVTTLFLINTVARNLDIIWGAQVQTGLFRRFTTYTAIIVFSSLLLGISNSITDVIESYISNLTLSGSGEYDATKNWFALFSVTLIFFFLMIIILPSVKIKVKSAIIGALFSAIFFEIVKFLFRVWAVNSARNSLIYGSLAIIPIFLVGLYLFWLIVLIGVEISFYIEHKQDPSGGNPVNLSMENRLTFAFDIFLTISINYRDKSGGITMKELIKELNIPSMLITHFITIFMENSLILKVSDKHGSYIPARSLDKVNLKDLFHIIYGEESEIEQYDKLSLLCAKSFTIGGYEAVFKGSILDLISENMEAVNEKES